ncbi:monofunctional biosynthetic peptidoglycan transglycosylase [Salinihabitans flavidus]|uniref:Biosynthetic peptidoglycan transglycosylase n=1 Tax=Salinihabitans flavidus TaxID=569882 RepID=A0A1H8QZZ6_9RHOB|nr:monofunctional biosynthetic peptidoglycan transglycosylase [Salinihabitans flavidus]SEO59666.1 monofunctional biosynthetic peptidoglycan transglycosylase [Salinihabitans flavidus]
MTRKPKAKHKDEGVLRRQMRRLRRGVLRGVIWAVSFAILIVLLFAVVNPPITYTMYSEKTRLGRLDHQWAPREAIAPVMMRSVVAAEDANFCNHWGFDMSAIRAALNDGAVRGASTISQQTVKNVYLWQGRSWPRKALEALLTPIVELAWSKRRILEIYLNVAEFGEGIFGVEAAARHYFDVGPAALSPRQAALLAAVLPSPRTRNAAQPSGALRQRAARIADGAATIARDGRAACFED